MIRTYETNEYGCIYPVERPSQMTIMSEEQRELLGIEKRNVGDYDWAFDRKRIVVSNEPVPGFMRLCLRSRSFGQMSRAWWWKCEVKTALQTRSIELCEEGMKTQHIMPKPGGTIWFYVTDKES
jgi:hypothetical protein